MAVSLSSSIAAQLRQLGALAHRLESERKALERELKELERRGLSEARPHWREGEYLYLVYPVQADGSRRREYVGSDPGRVEEALARVRRAALHSTATDRIGRCRQAMARLLQGLEQLRDIPYDFK